MSETLGNLIEKMKEEGSRLIETDFPKTIEVRKKLLTMLLGPSYFGNEEFFSYYCTEETDAHQIFFKYKQTICGPLEFYHPKLALVRAKKNDTIEVYIKKNSTGAKYDISNNLSPSTIKEHMKKISIDELAGHRERFTDDDSLFREFWTIVNNETESIYRYLKRVKDALTAERSWCQKHIKKLQAVANLDDN